jgi:hypothetical protein
MMKKTRIFAVPTAFGALMLAGGVAQAIEGEQVDWSAIPASDIQLFFPGYASYQWVLSEEHEGARRVKEGRNCLSCHEGDEAEIGELIVSGEVLEPHPIPGKRGSVELTVQAAHDDENLYLRASWDTATGEPGQFHEYVRFTDGKWVEYGTHRGKEIVASGKAKASYEDRFSMLVGDGKGVPVFNDMGCWATCHNDARFMANNAPAAEVKAHPLLGDEGLKRSDVRKYLPATRTAMGDTGGWAETKTRAEIDQMKADGAFLDLWQWRANRSNPVGYGGDDYVLEYRLFDDGKNAWFGNWDGAKKEPRFMLDPASNNGRMALTEGDFRNPDAVRLTAENRVPYDPDHAWQEGDLMYQYGNQQPEGSAADNAASASFEGGRWTVVLKRKLNTGNSDDLPLEAGNTYPVGFAVHDDSTTARWHYVSWPLTMSLGGAEAHVNAVSLK